MAAISKALANSLDRLRETIGKAEDKLATLPGSNTGDVSVRCLDLDQGGFHAYLDVTVNGKDATIEVYDWEPDEEVELNRLPVVSLPAGRRIQAAKYIPKLIEKAYAVTDKLAEEVDQTVAEIERAL